MARYRSQRARERAEYDPLDPAKQHEPVEAGTLVSKLVDGRVLAGASDASRALVTWRRIAGRRAAKHTVTAWLKRPKTGDGLPELVVYLDGNALMADLSTNAELFVDRLAYAGLEVSRVSFRLSRKAGQGWGGTGAAAAAGSNAAGGGPGAGPDAPAYAPGAADSDASATTAPTAFCIDPSLGPVAPAPLTPLEEARVRAACEHLPEQLRTVASEAMRLSLQRQKSLNTREG